MSFRFLVVVVCAWLQCFPATPALAQAAAPAKTNPSKPAYNPAPWTGDLDGMVQRRQIRVLVPYNKTLYFLDKGAIPRGLIVDMMAAFENDLNAQVKNKQARVHVLLLPTSREQLIPDLLAGKGDLVAANLTVTEERRRQVDFSTPVGRNVREILVTSPAGPNLKSLDDLAGKEIFINPASSYRASVEKLNQGLRAKGLKPAVIRDAPGIFETDDILEMVNANLAPITVADDYLAIFWKEKFPNIRLQQELALKEGSDIAFAFRKGSPRLKAALDPFVDKHRLTTASATRN